MIIFDLDDTLIDTSGSITPFKCRAYLECLQSQGYSLPQNAFETLSLLSEEVGSLQKAVTLFSPFSPSALNELTAPLPEHFEVKTTPFAKEILQFLHLKFDLALVTRGNLSFQMDKMEKAGLDPSMFGKISAIENGSKKSVYKEVGEYFSVAPEEVWVCGDRVELDLLPAAELGFHTIHIRWGRGKKGSFPVWIDRSIESLQELKEIFR